MSLAQSQQSAAHLRGEFGLYRPVAHFFKQRGYFVRKGASKYGDVIGYNRETDILVSVEVKFADARAAIGQALSYREASDLVYIAISESGKRWVDLVGSLGLGLLLVGSGGAVTQRLAPTPNSPKNLALRAERINRTLPPNMFLDEEGRVFVAILQAVAAGCPAEVPASPWPPEKWTTVPYLSRRSLWRCLRKLSRQTRHDIEQLWDEEDWLSHDCHLLSWKRGRRDGRALWGCCISPETVEEFGGVEALFAALTEVTSIQFDGVQRSSQTQQSG